VREVWVHAVDLAAGATFADLPADVADAMLDDVTAMLSAVPECPPVTLAPVDRDRTWRLGAADQEPAEVTAPAADLLAWVTGREAGADLGAGSGVALPPWL
jgi:maleylpyruvate isomerase